MNAENWEEMKATNGRRNKRTGARNNCGICHGTGKRRSALNASGTKFRVNNCGCHIHSGLMGMQGLMRGGQL